MIKIEEKDISESIENKESIILSTIIVCNKMIKDLQKKMKNLVSLCECDKYHYNFLETYSKIYGINIQSLNESIQTFNDRSFIPLNERNNYYNYFLKVESFLNGYNLPLQKSLNEALELNLASEIKRKFGISDFKDDLKSIITKLEKIDEVDNCYDNQILKIKVFAKKPIFVYGFDLINSIALQNQIINNFKKDVKKLLSLCFDKTNKELLFVFDDELLSYGIKNDEIKSIIKTSFNTNTYMTIMKENLHNNIIELYQNKEVLSLKFSDNLYGDIQRERFQNLIKSQIIK